MSNLMYNVISNMEKQNLQVKHYMGYPPELTKDNKKTDFPIPKFLIIETKSEGVFLTRYSDKGEFAGDTWHQNIEEAKDQAKLEYGQALEDWKEAAVDSGDAIEYILKNI